MTSQQIDGLIRGRYCEVEGSEDRWRAKVGELYIFTVIDADNDRVRVMVPVAEIDDPDSATFMRLLEANFINTRDVRYAIYNQILWTLYVAPLSTLHEQVLDSAMTQVVELARTTGTTYSAMSAALGAGGLQVH